MKDGTTRKALVLGNDTRAFLSVVRSLGRGGVQVHVGNCDRDCATLRSRYVFKVHDLPRYVEGDPVQTANWKAAMIQVMKQEKFDLIIPCDDSSLLPLQNHRQELEPYGRIYLLNEKAFAAAFDKFTMNELARSVGVTVPKEFVVTRPEEAQAIRSTFNLPVVLKPRTSFTVKNLQAKQHVRKAYTWEEFDELLSKMISTGSVAVQENFRGDGVGVELLLHRGEPLLTFQHVRVHEPLQGGGSSYRKSVPVTPELLDASVKLMRLLDYTGVAMVEFKVDPVTKDWRLIEVNGRFWGSLPLAVAAGADFPLALFQLLVEGKKQFSSKPRVNIHCRNWQNDLRWLWLNLRADRSDPYLATRPPLRDALNTFGNVLTLRERSDTLTLDDPKPGLTELSEMGREAWGPIQRRFTQKWLQLPWNRRRLANTTRAALGQAKTILFVCKGNICRSPFAERIARQRDGARTWLSAGYYPAENRRSPETAVDVAEQWSVSLADHRSRRLDKSLIDSADVLFVFDFSNYQTLLQSYPDAKRKVRLVGALRPTGPLFIRDPYGGSPEDFTEVYDEIDDALKAHLVAEARQV